ncbi:MAG: hypothetical protein J6C77_04835 [Muribaculaceae bacterium]|nr:hypothetical protein [Muribaculaceae bacterium]
MKLNNNTITSLIALNRNFNFVELWGKREQALYALHPSVMPYHFTEALQFYMAFASAGKYLIDKKSLISPQGENVEINLTEEEWSCLEPFTPKERVEIIALHRLAMLPIGNEINDVLRPYKECSDEEIELLPGATLPCDDIKQNAPATLQRRIIRAPQDTSPCHVGSYLLPSGKATYGVFQGDTLVAVAPPSCKNAKYRLEYMRDNDGLTLLVTSLDSAHTRRMPGVCFYNLLEPDDFLFIRLRQVRTNRNETLNLHFNNYIQSLKNPLIVECKDCGIRIVYESGKETYIDLPT